MRIKQDRTPLGCFWGVAIVWGVLTIAFPNTGILANEKWWLGMAAVTALFLIAIYFTIERKVFADSFLTFDEPPESGRTFRAKIETPLKGEVACKVLIGLLRSQRRAGQSWLWKTETTPHPIRGDKGLILPLELAIPPEAGTVDAATSWTVRATGRTGLIPYRATFTLPKSAPEQ